MRKPSPINVIIYSPETLNQKTELAKRVSEIHTDAVIRRVMDLKCPGHQKQALLDAVIDTAKRRIDTDH